MVAVLIRIPKGAYFVHRWCVHAWVWIRVCAICVNADAASAWDAPTDPALDYTWFHGSQSSSAMPTWQEITQLVAERRRCLARRANSIAVVVQSSSPIQQSSPVNSGGPVADTVKHSKVCRDALDTAFEITRLIKFSPKTAFDRIKSSSENDGCPSPIGIRTFCHTQWTVRGDAIESILLLEHLAPAFWHPLSRK